ncbi:MAG: hypothetical protein HKP22_05495 [Gammaproteobacteria bacterium]|nr:hypothetical protein [Gammaproteobacteria bacterium]
MKPTIILLTLSLYSTALLAEQADNKNLNTEARYGYLNHVSSMMHQSTQAFKKGPHFRKLIQPVEKETDVKLIKAELQTRRYLKRMA